MRMNARCERSDQLDDNTLPEAGEDLIVGNYYPRFRVHSCILRRSWPEFDKVLGSILVNGVYTQNFRQLPRLQLFSWVGKRVKERHEECLRDHRQPKPR